MALKRENEKLKASLAVSDELVNHLRCMPENIAHETLQKLRASSDPAWVLRSIDGDVPGVRLLEHTTARAMLPEIRSGTEFELMVRYSISYPRIDPLKIEALSRTLVPRPHIMLQSNPESDTRIIENFDLTSERDHQTTKGAHASPPAWEDGVQAHDSKSNTGPLLNSRPPDLSIRHWDQLLIGLDIAFWTPVPVTNQFAANVISLYLETDHPIIGIFDARSFVNDLLDCKLQFCSPFLVNSLLSFACVSPKFHAGKVLLITSSASLRRERSGGNCSER